MAAGFSIKIVTPEDVFLEDEAVSLVVPGYEGYLGVLRGHAPLVTPLSKGNLYVRLAGGSERRFEVEGGFLEVSHNQALILVERIRETAGAAAAAAV